MLFRKPNTPEVDPRTTSDYLDGFDFSTHALERRRRRIPLAKHYEFRIERLRDGIRLSLDGLSHDLPAANLPILLQHLLLKQLLNIHSTLVMGRLGQFRNLGERPSNRNQASAGVSASNNDT